MRRLFLTAGLLGVLTCSIVEAQTLPFRTYSIEQGLSESVVYEVLQDDEGFLWIGTNYGLNRFDGIAFRQYHVEDGLRGHSVLSLFEDKKGKLWIGTDQGVNRFLGDSLVTPEALAVLNGTPINDIMQDRKGRFWFSTRERGIWRWSPKKYAIDRIQEQDGLAGNRVREIVQVDDRTYWIATRSGLTLYQQGTLRSFDASDGLPSRRIRDLLVGPNQSLWIATRGGLSYYRDGRFTNYTEKEGLINNRIRSLSRDSNGHLWIATEEGLSYMRNGHFSNFTPADGLPNPMLYASLIDREGNLWLGSYGGGLIRLTGHYFRNFTSQEGLPGEVVTSFAETRSGEIWIGTYGGGIARYDGKKLTHVGKEEGLVDEKVYTLMRDRQNRIWVGTRWGLSIYDEGEFTNFSADEMPHRKVRAVHQSRQADDRFWIGTYGGGLLRFEDGRFRQFTREEGLPHNIVMDIVETGTDTLWLATYGGVSRKTGRRFTNFTQADGLPANGILDILVDKNGRIWVATFEGIAYYQNGVFTPITKKEGLPASLCYFLQQDENSNIWIGTNKGVVRFNPASYLKAETTRKRMQSFKIINKSQGLVADEMNVRASLEASDGSLWFGSVGGASRLLPDRDPPPPVHPKIHINNLRVAEEMVPMDGNLSFESDENNLRFDYIGISLQAPHLVQYEYRLIGAENRWFQTDERRVRYTSLPPGKYTFQVRARNADRLWSRSPASVEFSIQKPYWMTWWFLLLVIAGISAIIWFIYRYYRMKKKMEMERMRVRIASDLHDDVGSALTEIALQTDFLQEHDQMEADELQETLRQIGSQSRKIVSGLDDIVWSIDARNDTVGDLTDRMQDYTNRVLDTDEIQINFDISDLEMDQNLAVEKRENIYLIFKEAVNNIAKHSNADRVDILLRKENDGLALYVEDNGNVERNTRLTGQGLHNMRMRVRRLGARMQIDHENGFCVRIKGI